MNEQSAQKSRNWKPLLLIPAVVMVAKAASHHRMRWDSAAGPEARAHRHGRRGFGPRGWMADDGTIQIPPKIEAMLGAWHTQAHAKDQTTDSETV